MRDRIVKLATTVKFAESELAKWKKKMKVKMIPADGFSVGYSERDHKYYGWSHRARFGWKVGDKVNKDTCGNPKPGKKWTIKTEAEAKQVAIAFAKDVS